MPFDPEPWAGPPADVPAWHPDYVPARHRRTRQAPPSLTIFVATVLLLGGIVMLQTGTDVWLGTMMLVVGLAMSVRDLWRVRDQHLP